MMVGTRAKLKLEVISCESNTVTILYARRNIQGILTFVHHLSEPMSVALPKFGWDFDSVLYATH